MKLDFRQRLLATTLFVGAGLIATPAFAQDVVPPPCDAATNPDCPAEPPAGPAAGQTTPETNAAGAPVNEISDIVVTGSRIPQPNLTAVSPVTVVTNQEFKLSGTTRAEDLLNTLPQVFADQGSQVANGATGTATVNLRNLGANRTLVLINGRRLVPGDPTDSAADINFIPVALVKRVDVLTGGASSTYGADAVGGVVNFIMDTTFTGLRIDGQYSLYQHNNDVRGSITDALDARGFGYPTGNVADGGTIDLTGVMGADFDDNRGHVVAYAGYRKSKAITQDRRDYSACSLGVSGSLKNPNQAGNVNCGGSATSANGTIIAFTGGTPGDLDEDGNPAPFAGGTSTLFQVGANRTFLPGFTAYNFAPTNYYQRPDERYTLGFFANYEVSDAVKPYLEGMFMDDRSVAQIAPSGDFGNTFSLNCDNPLLSAQQLAIICAPGNLVVASRDPVTGALVPPPSPTGGAPATVTSDAQAGFFGSTPFQFVDPLTGRTYTRGFAQILKRNVEGAPRQDDLQHTSYRLVGGVRGDLNRAFSYDAYYQFGRTNYSETYLNDFSVTRLGRALDVVYGTDTNGDGVNDANPVCRSALDGSDPNCVPYDIFTVGGVTPEAVNYLATPGFQRGQVEEQVAQASVTGQLGEYGFQSPWATEGVGMNLGVEYRKESLNLNSDIAFQTGDLAGQGAATLPVNGSFNVKEVFGEVRVPIIQDNFIESFVLEGGYRYSHYEVGERSFNTDTYKVGADLAPIKAVRFRAAYNRAVRSPNIQEFFAPQRVALNGSTDPCAGRVLTAADAGCLAQGLSIGQNVVANPAEQYNGLIGGNPDLTPEKADTYTAGVVIQPDFVPFLSGLAITVDYFKIKVSNLVSGIGQDTILSECTANAASPFCSFIHRDSTGSLWRSPNGYVVDLTQNIGGLRTSGVDIGASYAHQLGGFGSVSFNFNGTYLDELRIDNGVAEPYDCAGLYGNVCGTPSPEWRHKARVTFALPSGIGLSAQWRHFSSVLQDATSDNPTLEGDYYAFNRKIKAQNYFDLAMTAAIGDQYTFRMGVQNIFDREPPLVSSAACPAGFCNGNTYPVVYDALGRYLYAGVSLKL